jgi:hypothetical protein
MAEQPPDPRRDPHTPPDPGQEAAPDASSEGVDARVAPEGDEIERVAESSTGPGAGESELVKVTTPRAVDDEDIPRHPTLGGQ